MLTEALEAEGMVWSETSEDISEAGIWGMYV